MRKKTIVVLLALILVAGMLPTASLAAKDLPEIEITWLSVSGRPDSYYREHHLLKIVENESFKCFDLRSGEVNSEFYDILDSVPIPCEYSHAGRVWKNSDGSQMGVSIYTDTEDGFGFVDAAGKLIIPCEYHDYVSPSDYAESFAVCLDGKWGFVDRNNKPILSFEWDYAGGFYENRAIVARYDEWGNRKWGYIDPSGQVVVPLEYDDGGSFWEGRAIVARYDEWGNLKWGYIDPSGKIVAPLEYDKGWDFCEGRAAVARYDEWGNLKWGYIDPSGKVVVPLEYDKNGDFHEGLAAVGFYDALGDVIWGCIDTSGEMVLPMEYECNYLRLHGCQAGLIAAMKNGKYGCFNASGEMILPMEYDDIEYLGDGMYMVQKGASYGIFESPYWRNSEFVLSHSAEVSQSPNIVAVTVVVFLVITVCAVGFLFSRRQKSDD